MSIMQQHNLEVIELQLDKVKYNKMVENIEIINILLKSINLNDVKLPNINEEKYDVKLNYKCESFEKFNNNIVEFYPKFILDIDYKEKNMLSLEFELRVIYKLDDIDKYEDEYILKFIEINLPINIWPYAREIISSMTTRIGYPVLVISPYKG